MLVFVKRLGNIIAITIAIMGVLWIAASSFILLYWFVSGGVFEIGTTIVITAEQFFQHDWKISEVVLVLLVFFLVIRKRRSVSDEPK